jgi:hypothetical protein
MQAGDICTRTGIYCCGYHRKKKMKIAEGSAFNRCDYNGLKCEGFWCFIKEVKVKSHEEIKEANNRKRYRPRRSKRQMSEKEFKARLMKPS